MEGYADTLKMNGYAFKGSNSLSFLPPTTSRGQLLKKRICSSRSKFFPLREDPILRRLRPPGKQTGSHDNCLPLKTLLYKKWVYPYTLIFGYYSSFVDLT